MNTISEIKTIQEFTNDSTTCGVYSLLFKGEQKIFIRNGDSIGVVSFLLGRSASQCVSEIRDDIKYDFLAQLFLEQTRKSCAECEHWGGSDCTLVAPDSGCIRINNEDKTTHLCDTCSKCFATCDNGEEGKDFFFGLGLGYDNVYKCKAHEPTPKPETTNTDSAKWENGYCSKCKMSALDFVDGYQGDYHIDYLPNHCPNCGAKMNNVL